MDFITIKPLRSEFYFENIILTRTEEGHKKDLTKINFSYRTYVHHKYSMTYEQPMFTIEISR